MTLPQIDPVFLRLGPLEFRWYGLMYIIGFVSSYFIIRSGARRQNLPLSNDDVADLVFNVAVGIILGGRFGYILFYNLSYYLSHPAKLFAVWEGGMSFHGGLLGGIIAGVYFARKRKLGFWKLVDLAFLSVPVGIGLGRIGNFINGELYGRVTDSSLGVVFPSGGTLPRHPSQLYEALLEGVLMFIILRLISSRRHPEGVIFWTFIGCYGLFRSIVELFREPDQQMGFFFGGVTMGQMLSVPMLLLGIFMVVRAYRIQRYV